LKHSVVRPRFQVTWYTEAVQHDSVTLPNDERFEDMFPRFDRIHERNGQTDKQTDGRTLRDGIGRACAQHRAANRKPTIRLQKALDG